MVAPKLNPIAPHTLSDTPATDTFTDLTGQFSVDDKTVVTYSVRNAIAGGGMQGYTHYVSSFFGRLYFNENTGLYKFVVNADNINRLATDETQRVRFEVTASKDGETSPPRTLTITATGADESVILTNIDGHVIPYTSATDDFSDTTITGRFFATTTGSGTIKYTVAGAVEDTSQGAGFTHSRTGFYGKLYFNENTGRYNFIVNDAAVNALTGRREVDNFRVGATDGTNQAITKLLSITFVDSADIPVLTLTPGAATINDESTSDDFSSITGTFSATADAGETITYYAYSHDAGDSIPVVDPTLRLSFTHKQDGDFGTLYYNQRSGAYEYVPNDDDINELGAVVRTDTFTVRAFDGVLGSATKTLTITIRGADDAPILGDIRAVTLQDTSTADSFTDITGTFTATDVDSNRPFTFSATGAMALGTADQAEIDLGFTHKVGGTYGTLYYKSGTGEYKYVANNAAINALALNERGEDAFSITANDGQQTSAAKRLVITVRGVDEAVVLGAITPQGIDDTSIENDFDNLEGSFSATTTNAGGTIRYAVALGSTAAEAHTDYTEMDNDGNVDFTSTHRITGTFGTLYYDEVSGDYRYVPDNDKTNAVSPAGASETFSVTARDGTDTSTPQILTITITGANDRPIVTPITAEIRDRSTLDDFSDLTGSFTATADTGETITYSVTNAVALDPTNTADNAEIGLGFTHKVTTGTYGTLYYKSGTGEYKYVPNDAKINALGTNEERTDTFSITASDGTSTSTAQTFTITLRGTDDIPILQDMPAVTLQDTSTADSFADIVDRFPGSDADTGDTLTYTVRYIAGQTITNAETHAGEVITTDANGDDVLSTHRIIATYGTFYYNENTGNYKYVVDDDAIHRLGANENGDDTFSVVVSDGEYDAVSKRLVINVRGADETVTLNAITPQTIDDTTAADNFDNLEGSFSATTDGGGTIAYTVAQGGTAAEAYADYTETDDNGNTDFTSTHRIIGTYGTLYYNSGTGAYRYVPDNVAINGLLADAEEEETFSVTASVGTDNSMPQTFTITLTGATDSLVFNPITEQRIDDTTAADDFDDVEGSFVAIADNDKTLTYSVTGDAADTSESGFTRSVSGTYGKLYYNQGTGEYKYVPNDVAINALGTGANTAETFTVTVTDGTTTSAPQILTIRLTGATDQFILRPIPSVTLVDTSIANSFDDIEGSFEAVSDLTVLDSVTYSVANAVILDQTNADDKAQFDLGFTHKVTTGTYGTLYYNDETGDYKYVANADAINALNAPASPAARPTDEFSITATHTDGDSDQKTFTITLAGDNDVPILQDIPGVTLDDTTAVDSFDDIVSTFPGSDADTGATLTYTVRYVTSQGQTETFTDAEAHDSEVITTDANGDNVLSTHRLQGTYGTLYYNQGTGDYKYVANNAAINRLGADEDRTETFTVAVQDEHQAGPAGLPKRFVITIRGADDLFILNPIDPQTIRDTNIADDFDPVTGSFTTTAGAGATITYSVTDGVELDQTDTADKAQFDLGYTHKVTTGTYGTLYYSSSTGQYKYVPNDAKINELAHGIIGRDNFEVTANDGSETTISQTLIISAIGANDKPILTPITRTIDDTDRNDDFGNVDGTLTGTDAETGSGPFIFQIINADDVELRTQANGRQHYVYTGVKGNTVPNTDQDSAYTQQVYPGTYGTLYYNNGTGAYRYVPNDDAINRLGADETGTDSFLVSIIESSYNGNLDGINFGRITFTINGANDRPTLAGLPSITYLDTVNGQDFPDVTGTFRGGDVDTTDTLTYRAFGADPDTSRTDYTHRVDGTYGTLYFNENTGAYIYVADDAKINALGSGNHGESFSIVAHDGRRSSLTQTLSVSITGIDDIITLNSIDEQTINDRSTTGSFADVTGSFSASTTNAQGTLAYSVTDATADTSQGAGFTHSVDGTYGKLYYNSGTGAYKYVAKANAINGLGAGESGTDSFAVSVSDGTYNAVGQTLIININGENDVPILSDMPAVTLQDTAAVDSFDDIVSTFPGSDADTSATLTYTVRYVTSQGDTETVTDAEAHTDEVITTDANGDNVLSTHRIVGTYGTLYYNQGTGQYKYVANNVAINRLGADENGADIFSVVVSDGQADTVSKRLVINARGVADSFVLNPIATQRIGDTIDADDFTDLTGYFVAIADAGEAITYSATGAEALGTADQAEIDLGFTHKVGGTYGTLYYKSGTGEYKYVADNTKINELTTRHEVGDIFTITARRDGVDSNSQTLGIVITGANDAPILNPIDAETIGDTSAQDDFADLIDITGTFTANDADTGATLTYSVANAAELDQTDPTDDAQLTAGFTHKVTGTYGTLYYDEDSGDYEYIANNDAINKLAANETQTETFSVTASDGTASSAAQTFTININGANDIPVVAPITETFYDTSIENDFDDLTGSFSALTDTGETITYSVTGATADTTETGFTHSIGGTYGKLYYNQGTGAYKYVPDDDAINKVAEDATPADTFSITASDGTSTSTAQITINIRGGNDKPILRDIAGVTLRDTTAVDNLNDIIATFPGSDVDTGATLTYRVFLVAGAGTEGVAHTDEIITTDANGDNVLSTHRLQATYGTLYYNQRTGDYKYVVNDRAINALGTDERGTDTFAVTLQDDQNAASGPAERFIITVIGAADTTVLNPIDTHIFEDTIAQDDFADIDGSFTTIADNDKTITYSVANALRDISVTGFTHSVTGNYGKLYYNSGTGTYRYVPNDAAMNEVAANSNPEETFTVTANDGSADATQTLTIRIQGANDRPVVTPPTPATFYDTSIRDEFDQSDYLTGRFTTATDTGEYIIYDISGAEALSAKYATELNLFTHKVDGTYGTLFFNRFAGTYRYVPDADAINKVVGDATPTDTFTITATDDTYTSVAQTFTINIRGNNDRPILRDIAGVTLQDTAGADSFNDIVSTFPGSDVDAGAVLTYRVFLLVGAGTEGVAHTDETITTDANGDNVLSTHRIIATYGTLYYNQRTGDYKYVPDADAMNGVGVGETGRDRFAVTLDDEHNAASGAAEIFTISIEGANDEPVLNSFTTPRTLSIRAPQGEIFGQFSVTDPDINDDITFTVDKTVSSWVHGAHTSETIAPGISSTHRILQNSNPSLSNWALFYNENTGHYKVKLLGGFWAGDYDFNVKASDGTITTAERVLRVLLRNQEQTPVLASISDATLQDTADADDFDNIEGQFTTTHEEIGFRIRAYTVHLGDGTAAGTDNTRTGYTHSLQGTYGKFYFHHETGAYIYVVDDDAVNELGGPTESGTDEFSVTALNTGSRTSVAQTFTITARGAAEAVTLDAIPDQAFDDTVDADDFTDISASFSASTTTAGGTITYSVADAEVLDRDNADDAIQLDANFTHKVDGTYGTLYYSSSTGQYKYVVDDAAINALGADEGGQDIFSITANDGTYNSRTQTFTITVTGVDDAVILDPIGAETFYDTSVPNAFDNLEGSFSATTSTPGGAIRYAVTLTGKTTEVHTDYTEMDDDDNVDFTSTHRIVGNYGTLYYDEVSGDYRYVPDADAMNALGADATPTETFSVTASDGTYSSTVQKFIITIEGDNDVPILLDITGVAIDDTADDDNFRPLIGTFPGSDADTGATLTYTIFQIANPVISANPHTSEVITTDENGDDVLSTHRIVGTFGTLYYNQGTGDYKFVANDDTINVLGDNEERVVVFLVAVQDDQNAASSSSKRFAITITGVNDTPILEPITAEITDRSTPDIFSDLTGSFTATADTGATITYSVADAEELDPTNTADNAEIGLGFTHKVTTGTYGTLYYKSGTGEYKYVPNDAEINALGTNEERTDTFSITAHNGALASTAQTFTITLRGQDDIPILADMPGVTLADTIAADNFDDIVDRFPGSDADAGDALTYEVLRIATAITNAETHAGEVITTDENGDNVVSTHRIIATYGTLYYNTNTGDYKYVVNDAKINALGATGGGKDTFAVVVDDGEYSTVSKRLVITITGFNDAPVVETISGPTFEDTIDQDDFDNIEGTFRASDVDSSTIIYAVTLTGKTTDVHTVYTETDDNGNTDFTSTHRIIGTYGTLYYNSGTGAYRYVPNDDAMNGVGASGASETFSVTASDGPPNDGPATSTPQTLTITINGANDRPILNPIPEETIEDTAARDDFADTQIRQLSARDAEGGLITYDIDGWSQDTSESGFTYSIQGTYGKLYYDHRAYRYKYVPNDAKINALAADAEVTDRFTLTANDGVQTSEQRTITINIRGANDAPSLNQPAAQSFFDRIGDDDFPNIRSAFGGGDDDTGDTLTYSVTIGGAEPVADTTGGFTHRITGTYGTLYYDSNTGQYNYVPNDDAMNAVRAGEVGRDRFTVTVTDSGGLTDTATFEIAVGGSDDRPIFRHG